MDWRIEGDVQIPYSGDLSRERVAEMLAEEFEDRYEVRLPERDFLLVETPDHRSAVKVSWHYARDKTETCFSVNPHATILDRVKSGGSANAPTLATMQTEVLDFLATTPALRPG